MILKVFKFQQCVKGQAETAVARTILATFMARNSNKGLAQEFKGEAMRRRCPWREKGARV